MTSGNGPASCLPEFRGSGKVRAARRPPIVNAMTVDVEDYFQVEAFKDVINRSDWDSLPVRVEANTDRLLQLFSDTQVVGTFFVLGWVGERYPAIVRRIAAAGHEVASHGYAHERADGRSREVFRADILRAKAIL